MKIVLFQTIRFSISTPIRCKYSLIVKNISISSDSVYSNSSKIGIKSVSQSLYNPEFAPYDFWLFPNLRGCRYEAIAEMKEAVTKLIDTLTQEDFHGALQKFLERYKKCIAVGGDYFEGD